MSDFRLIKLTEISAIGTLSADLLKNIYTPEELNGKNDGNFNPEYLLFVLFVNRAELPLGRLAIYENPFIRVATNNALILGNFECIADREVADLLFKEAERFAKENAYSSLIGPINGSTWDNYRIPLESEYPRFFTEEIFKNYYSKLFEEFNFEILTEYYSGIIYNLNDIGNNSIQPRETFTNSSGLKIRSISKENFVEDIEMIYHFCMDAFSKNYLFSPISKFYFVEKYLPLKQYIDPDYCLMVFDRDNNLVSFFFCLPDILNSGSSTLIVKTIAGKSGRNYAGVSSWLFRMIVEKAIQNGYTQIINAFMHKNNVSLNISRKYKSEVIRTYRLYVKKLQY